MRTLINRDAHDVARKADISTEDVDGVLSRQIETKVDR